MSGNDQRENTIASTNGNETEGIFNCDKNIEQGQLICPGLDPENADDVFGKRRNQEDGEYYTAVVHQNGIVSDPSTDAASSVPLAESYGSICDAPNDLPPDISHVVAKVTSASQNMPGQGSFFESESVQKRQSGHQHRTQQQQQQQAQPPILPDQIQYHNVRSQSNSSSVHHSPVSMDQQHKSVHQQDQNASLRSLPICNSLHSQPPSQQIRSQKNRQHYQQQQQQKTQPQKNQQLQKQTINKHSSLGHGHGHTQSLQTHHQKASSQTSSQSSHTKILAHQGNPDQNFDSILKIPQTKDDIVETSPGERYLRFSEKLGSGAYKEVYRAYDTIEGIEVAWNVVNLSGVPKVERQYIVNEVRLLEKLNHSNIISFHGSWVNRELEQVIFVTEILSSGTLKSFINKVQVIRWKIAKRWAIQILKGLEYLHSQDPPIIHRDLKCDNIFINGTSGDLRIGDLGLSTVMSNKGKLSVLGTPEFMAPELYDETYDQMIDVYAFGMCMLEIFTKELPYRECANPAQIYKKVTHGTEPESLSRLRNSEAKEFIRLCLGTSNGSGGFTRPTATELLSHPFLAKKSDDDSEVEVDFEVDPRYIERQIPFSSGDKLRNSIESLSNENEISSRMDTQNEVDPSFMRKTLPERIPNPNAEGWRKPNDSSNIAEKEIYALPPSPPNSKYNTTREVITKKVAHPDLPYLKSNSYDNSVTQAHGDERNQNADANSTNSENASSHQKSLQDRGHHHQYNAVSIEQDLVATSRNDPNGTSNPGSGRFNDRDSIPDGGSGLESADEFVGMMPNCKTNQKMTGEEGEESVDEFVGMLPNSETNIRKVTVLMGRGQEIEDQDDLPAPASSTTPLTQSKIDIAQQTTHGPCNESESLAGNQQYFAANDVAVDGIEDNNLDVPFAQDKMTVLMTQSVEPYHVQFEFDLVEDDPVQVAREMVTELNMTQDAVLKLSENLSALARSARIKQKSSTFHQQQRHNSLVQSSVSLGERLNQKVKKNLSSNADGSNGNAQTDESNKISESHLQLSSPLLEVSERVKQEVTITTCESDDDDDSCSSECKQLKKEYENKMKRAKKAYDTRMENLLRSREEKEAQHRKMLEKHEKEKAAFANRLKQAEEEQNRRLLQIQEEWSKKCADAKKKVKSPQNSQLPPLPPHGEEKELKSLILGYEKNRHFSIPANEKNFASGASASSASTTPSLDGSCSEKSR